MSHSPCESRQEEIVALAIGELDPDRAAELLSHLETCPECRSLYEEVLQGEVFVRATFAKISRAIQPARANLRQFDRAVPPAEPVAVAARRSQAPRPRWRWTPLKVLALAAVFVLAASGLFSRLHLTSPSFGATFASVLQRLQKAKTVTYKMKVEVDGQEPREMHDMAMHPGCVRSVASSGEVFIRDYADGREAYIDPTKKMAQLTHMVRHDRQRLGHYLEWIATLHDEDGVFVGRQDIDGHKTNVFRISHPFEQITVWADVQTDLPVRVERVLSPCQDKDVKVPDLSLCLRDFQNAGSAAAPSVAKSATTSDYCRVYVKAPGVRDEKTTLTLTDFAWDVALDGALFQVTAPEGFRVTEVDFGEPPVGEEALVAALRFWAETSDGEFPADINMLSEASPKIVKKFNTGRSAEQEYADALKMAYVVANGMLFAQQLKAAGNWHYTGKDVKAGGAREPLCWWKDERGTSCRVIYGDLAIRDVLPTEVPQSRKP